MKHFRDCLVIVCLPVVAMLLMTLAADPASAATIASSASVLAVGTKTKIGIVVIILAAAGGAGYWFMNKDR